MEIAKMKELAKVGNITEEYIEYLKNIFISDILRRENQQSVNALIA